VYITTGRLDDIRRTFNTLAKDPRIMPPELIRDIAHLMRSTGELGVSQGGCRRITPVVARCRCCLCGCVDSNTRLLWPLQLGNGDSCVLLPYICTVAP
jgi:hypothetical protein